MIYPRLTEWILALCLGLVVGGLVMALMMFGGAR